MPQSKPKSLAAILATLFCGGAALFYEVAPDGPWKDAAGSAVRACEAAGQAVKDAPCPPPSAPVPPSPVAPGLVPEPAWLEPHLEPRKPRRSSKPRAGLPAERWRGESRGWARA